MNEIEHDRVEGTQSHARYPRPQRFRVVGFDVCAQRFGEVLINRCRSVRSNETERVAKHSLNAWINAGAVYAAAKRTVERVSKFVSDRHGTAGAQVNSFLFNDE
ncbi:MAG: hypothetical protein M3160_06470 [Candidatus Eremiobacteraeota bacterium]|nr:hypothetical protein [Candidatus Eremiobacteraeota bacterium]